MSRSFYWAMLLMSAAFEGSFALQAFLDPDSLVAADNTRAQWWLQAYGISIIALCLLSIMGAGLHKVSAVRLWIGAILGVFHGGQFAAVLQKDWPAIFASPGWAHGIVALICMVSLATNHLYVRTTTADRPPQAH